MRDTEVHQPDWAYSGTADGLSLFVGWTNSAFIVQIDDWSREYSADPESCAVGLYS